MSDKSTEYKPIEYWEGLLSRDFDLRDVGFPNLSIAFNKLMYRAMADSVDRGLRRLKVGSDFLNKASLFDVGSGTGFWVDYWLRKGVRDISGVDLTSESIAHLSQRYSQFKFEQRDVADPIHDDQLNAFDIISAMSVLHHIPSQERWEQALTNLGNMLKPGGYIIVMDPMLRHQWRGKPVGQIITGRPRKISEHLAVLRKTDVNPRVVMPTLALLSNPIDTKSKVEYMILNRWWRLFDRVATRQQVMRAASWLVYPADRALTRLNYMPSSKVVFCQKS